MKKLLSILLVMTLLLALGLPAFASGTISITGVTCTADSVSFTGTASGVKAAVAVRLYDGSDILAMESFLLDSGTFSGTISGLSLENGKTYTLKAADYDGGSWVSETVRFALTGTATISGNPVYGETLTAVLTDSNTVSGETLSYQWKRGSTDVATGDRYTLTAADVGSSLTVTISGDKHDGGLLSAATVTVAKAQGSVTAPTAKTDLMDTGSAQALVNAGSSETGTLLYKLGEDGTYSAELPTAIHAGTYTVYYMVQGDANHTDVAEANISVTIRAYVAPYTPPAEDNKTEEKTETIENEHLTVAVSENKATVQQIQTTASAESELPMLDFSELDSAIKEVSFSPDTAEALAGFAESGVSIQLADVNIALDAQSMQAVMDKWSEEALTLSFKSDADAREEMSEQQLTNLDGLYNSTVLSISLTAGDTPITDFGGGTVNVSVDYDWDGEGVLRSMFLASDGGTEATAVSFLNDVATLTLNHFSSYVLYTEEALPFMDVTNPMEYYYDPVKWALEKEITTGMDDTHFAPLSPCTRAQMVTFLWRAVGSPVVNYAMSFTDVAEDSWYAEAVRWAASEGITNGTGGGRFSPDQEIDRAQIVTMLYRYSKAPAFANMTANGPAPSPYEDVSNTAYYYNAVLWATSQGITDGTGEATFSPTQICKRAEIVTFLYRLLNR